MEVLFWGAVLGIEAICLKVLILVLMEVLFWACVGGANQPPSPRVLILVLMEVLFWVQTLKQNLQHQF